MANEKIKFLTGAMANLPVSIEAGKVYFAVNADGKTGQIYLDTPVSGETKRINFSDAGTKIKYLQDQDNVTPVYGALIGNSINDPDGNVTYLVQEYYEDTAGNEVFDTTNFTGTLRYKYKIEYRLAPNSATGQLSTAFGLSCDEVTITRFSGAPNFTRQDSKNVYHSGDIEDLDIGTVTASGLAAFAEGAVTVASGNAAHAEGTRTLASGNAAHAEGYLTKATGSRAHAEGWGTMAAHNGAHAEGFESKALGEASHAEGKGTVADATGQHVQGRYNISDENALFIIGNGEDNEHRSNLHVINNAGDAWFAGDIYIGSTSGVQQDGGAKKVATEEYVNAHTGGANLIIDKGEKIYNGSAEIVLCPTDEEFLQLAVQSGLINIMETSSGVIYVTPTNEIFII